MHLFVNPLHAVVFLLSMMKVFGLEEPPMDEAHKKDLSLFESIYQMLQSCVIKEDVKVEECLEMFRGSDPNNPKYKNCKCLVPCVAKLMESMNPDGTYDFTAFRKLRDGVESDYYKKEITRLLDICETEPGTDCEGGFNIINCAIQHSHIASRGIRMMFEALDEHYSKSSKIDDEL